MVGWADGGLASLLLFCSDFYHSFTHLSLKITRMDHSAGMQGQNPHQIMMTASYEWKHLNNGCLHESGTHTQ